jgi:hypothetical protein
MKKKRSLMRRHLRGKDMIVFRFALPDKIAEIGCKERKTS